MSATEFTPTVYLKQGCPFRFKLRLLLLEAGLSDRVTLVEGRSPEEHQALASRLVEKTGKASFPTAEVAREEFLAESDALVAHFSKIAGVSPDTLPTYRAFADDLFPRFGQLYRENAELRKQLA